MRARTIALTATLIAVSFAGCVQEGEGTASLYVKDAPTDEFEEVHVVFEKAYVHQANGTEDEADNESDEDEESDEGPGTQGGPGEQGHTSATFGRHGGGQGPGTAQENRFSEQAGWLTLVDEPDGIDVNLLNATGTRAAFLGEANLTSGTYTQIAVVVQDAYGIDDNGSRVDITVPSGVGRIVQSFEVPNGEEAQIIIDLELDRALVDSGQGWKLTPKFGTTTVNTVSDEEAGSEQHEPGEVAEVGE